VKSTIVALLAVALMAAGCSCGTNPADDLFGANDVCPAPAPLPETFGAAPDGPCGPPPDEKAAPGEVWCCVPVEIAGAPQRVCVQEECQKRHEVPAEYETVTERVMIAPARTEWQRIDCTPAQEQSGTTECWQLVEIPAQYEDRVRKVLKSPATFWIERVPAKFEDIHGAPSVVYRWQRFKDCEIPANAVSTFGSPDADDCGPVPAPPAPPAPPAVPAPTGTLPPLR
jgi:hypothetical protein